MKLRRIFIACFMIFTLMSKCMLVYADDTVITLTPDARQFTTINKDLDFRGMEPGEERTAQLTIVNSSDNKMDFFISGEIIDNIADESNGSKNAVYEIALYKNDDTVPFYDGIIGSSDNKKVANSKVGLDYLKEDTIIASLNKGESSVVTIKVNLDGDSTESEYMNKSGVIRFNIETAQSGKLPTDNTKKDNVISKIKKQVSALLTVKTADQKNMYGYMAAALAALIVAVFILLKIIKQKRMINCRKVIGYDKKI